ncbi:MAG TPA: ATP-dependent zinc metalloprotease FtsH [Polyangiaceae bacterium]|nr:ATP-dependent zinc metalloprotease FtsH [Polyangiaceae bacterium]
MLFVLLAGMWIWQLFGQDQRELPTIPYSAFYSFLEEGKIGSINVSGQSVSGRLKDPETFDNRSVREFKTTLPSQPDSALFPLLREKKVDIQVRTEEQPFALQLMLSLLPWVLIVGAWFWLSRRIQRMSPGGPLSNILKSRPRRFEVKDNLRVRFDDVAGLRSAKQDLQEIVDFLREPARFRRLGGKVPRGVLLVGPPGTGKTLVARAVAGESGVPFFSINGSEFIELFVGVGASRVRELFDEAKKAAPAIIFIDEIDAVGRVRGTGLGGGNDEREQTLNQLLSEMDGFTRSDLTIVLAATNRPDVLDPALLRPGRFDRRVVIERPASSARLAILEVHTRGKPLSTDVNLADLASNTPGFSGADLANLVNEAALNATRRAADSIEASDFSAAFDKVVLGDPREARLTVDDKRRVATHESGHAIVAHFTPFAEPLRRVTILPRGLALGLTQQNMTEDRHLATQPELEAKLCVLLGGYAAEELIYESLSSGSENDLKQATELAYKMVAHYGMSKEVGPVYHEHHPEHPFLGQTLATDGGISDATVFAIENEARRILALAVEQAKRCITQHRPSLERLVDVLLEQESIERTALLEVLGEPDLPRVIPPRRSDGARV